MRYHCELCDREGHLEEFCFRRKRAVRREQERLNADMYSARVHDPLGVVIGEMLGHAV